MSEAWHDLCRKLSVDFFYDIGLNHDTSAQYDACRIKNMDQGRQPQKNFIDPCIDKLFYGRL